MQMASAKYLEVVNFLSQNFHNLIYQGGGGVQLNFPEFDVMPFDYLEFAEQEIERDSTASKINCIAHLKRAVECELDTFFSVLGILKKSSNFPHKLNFAGDVGIISSRSLAKLNKMRNQIEHEYAIPDTSELDIYFDLASGFVHTVEGYIFMLHSSNLLELSTSDYTTSITAQINIDTPSVEFKIQEGNEQKVILFEASTLPEYSEGLKIFFLLCRGEGLLSHDYILAKLNGKSFLV
jgi:hypothetical protein